MTYDIESAVLNALASPDYDFRTVQGIADELGISSETVLNVIRNNEDKVRRSPIPDVYGRDLYTLRKPKISQPTGNAWDWDSLAGEDFELFRRALMSAYPNRDYLKIMLREKMDVSMVGITQNDSYEVEVFDVLVWMKAEGRRKEFFEKALEDRPNNSLLKKLKAKSEA